MSESWSIDVTETRRILAAAEAETGAFDTAAEGFASELAGAAGAVSGTKTAAALLGLADDPLTVSTASARRHLTSATAHTAEAVNAYDRGDLEMAERSQRKLDEVSE